MSPKQRCSRLTRILDEAPTQEPLCWQNTNVVVDKQELRSRGLVAFALIGYQVESALFEIEGIDSSPIQSSFIFEATLCNFQSKHIKNWQDRKRIVITC
jgi:hypothetical protein